MDKNKKNILTIIFLIGNIIFWSIVVFPTFVKFYHVLTKPASLTSGVVPRPQTSGNVLKRIDFYDLRDPFSIPQKKIIPQKHRKLISRPTRTTTSAPKHYRSSFKLNSIVLLENRNVASLQKKTSSAPAQNTPYSYRFGNQTAAPQGQTYSVLEGDVIDGEKVVKITKNSVILSKNNQYYRLTFSGGGPVAKP